MTTPQKASFTTILASAACAMLLALAAPGRATEAAPSPPTPPAPLSECRQLFLVLAPDWNATRGGLTVFVRDAPDQPWREDGERIEVLLGRSGLGWGLGVLKSPADEALSDKGPRKAEGDGRAPAGVFLLGRVFGYEPLAPPALASEFLRLGPSIECVDDDASRFYNKIVDRKDVIAPDWNSSETMLRPDGQYRVGAEVKHNVSQVPKAGSCIFLHIHRNKDNPTSGCTAMSAPDMERVARAIDPARRPLFVQLPQPVYERLKAAWGLP